MTTKNDIFEGLHVLLVTEDDARAQALSKALRDRKAHVGDVKAGARDPVALRGADLLLIDQRTADVTKSRVSEMRADVRARWASVATLDFAKLVLDDGAIYLSQLEEAVTPLTAGDKALTERARKEGVFETTLAPLGPSRTLRALALAGPTLHVELSQGQVNATVCLSNELLVCAFVERGEERYEAWAALARILGLTDAVMHVEKRAHPTAMNIMEPINQALEVAAQERQSTANLRPVELPKPVVTQTAEVPVGAQAKSTAAAVAAGGAGAKRTLLGMSPGLGGTAPRAPVPPGSSGYSLRQETTDRTAGGERPAAVKSTMLGMAKPAFVAPAKPGPEHEAPTATAPMLGRAALPDNDTAPTKSEGEAQARRKSRPELEPVRLDDDLLPRAKSTPELSNMGARGFRDRQKPPGRLDPMPQAAAQKPRSRPELKPVELPEEPVTVPPAARASAVERTLGNVANVGLSAVQEEPTAQGGMMERVTFGDQPTDPSLQTLPASLLEEARRPDLPPLAPAVPPPPPRSSEKLDELKSMAGERPTPIDPEAAGRSEAITKPFDTSSLMAAIEEEQPFAGNEGAQQLLDAVVRKRVQEETLIVVRREQRKSRAVMLFVLFLVVVGEYFALRWFEENGHKNELAPTTGLAAPVPGKPTAPAGSAAVPGAAAPGAAVAEPGQAPEQPAAEAAQPGADPGKPAAETGKPATEAAKPTAAVAKPTSDPAKPEPKAEAAKPEPTPEPAKPEPTAQAPEPAAAADSPSPAQATAAAGPAAGASSDSLVHDGTDLLSKGDAASAKAYFLQASTVDPKNAHAFAGLAEAELALSEHHNALQHIEQAIKLRPKRARYRVTQGDIFKALGKPDEALAAYRKGLAIDPEDREAKRRLGE